MSGEPAHAVWPAVVIIAPEILGKLLHFLHNPLVLEAVALGTGFVMAALSLTRFAPQGDGRRRPWLAAYFLTFSSLTAATWFFDVSFWAMMAVPAAAALATVPLHAEVKHHFTD